MWRPLSLPGPLVLGRWMVSGSGFGTLKVLVICHACYMDKMGRSSDQCSPPDPISELGLLAPPPLTELETNTMAIDFRSLDLTPTPSPRAFLPSC